MERYYIAWFRKSDGITYLLHTDGKFHWNTFSMQGLNVVEYKTLRGAEMRAARCRRNCNDGYIAIIHGALKEN